MEVSFSFMAWLCVLLIQAVVHVKVIYLRRGPADDDEPILLESDSSEHSWTAEATAATAKGEDEDTRQRARSYSDDPALDDSPLFDEDDDPPNLKQRLSQTGSEMMSSCKSLESIVHEQVQMLSQ